MGGHALLDLARLGWSKVGSGGGDHLRHGHQAAHMLVRPPWKAILNMVFLARLKGKIDQGCYWSFGGVV